MKLPSQLSKLIGERRQLLGLTQGELAEAAGVSRAMLGRLDRGQPTRADATAISAIAVALGLPTSTLLSANWDHGQLHQKLQRRGASLIEAFRDPRTPPSTEPPAGFEHKLSSGKQGQRARELELKLEARADARDISLALGQTWCDSQLEGTLWLTAAVGSPQEPGLPIRLSLASLRFHHRRVTCPAGKRHAGDLDRLAWHCPNVGILFPQVTMVADRFPRRVDALVAATRGRFGIIEVDGEDHDPSYDKIRERELGLPTLRLDADAVADRGLFDRLSRWAANLPHLSEM